ncbi:MAG: hypothetical protein M1484_03005 [Patescibacteria group bacterium]|nr:hypothetical protein [Patescibacteria group bacterium]MCL5432042.1 hypothetical protein [Patescibacteria group bacterium]
MDKDKVEKLAEEYSQVEKPEMNKILSMLRTRVAGGLEILHQSNEAHPTGVKLTMA